MVLANYVILQEGQPARMHFTEVAKKVKTITDPETGRAKPITTLEFAVDQLNGRAAISTYSVSSQKHAQDFAPYLPGDKFRDYDFIITMSGQGYRREYSVQVVPHPK